MQSRQDTPVSQTVRTILILFGIFGFLSLLMLIAQIVFPLSFPPFPAALPDMPHRVARIAFVAFWSLVWFIGLGYLTWLIVRSSRAQALGMPMDLPQWITSTTPLTPLRAIALLVSISFFKTLYQMIFANEPFTILLTLNGMIFPTMMVIWSMSLQSIKANAGEQKPVQDSYAGLAIAGYVLGTVSCFFVSTIYLFSPPFALVGMLLSVLGRKSFTHRTWANWGLRLSVVGVLAPIMVIMISMTLSHCSGWPAWDCSIPVGIDELFH